jgi:hypothetical protein
MLLLCLSSGDAPVLQLALLDLDGTDHRPSPYRYQVCALIRILLLAQSGVMVFTQ